jgi:hypothetical protein
MPSQQLDREIKPFVALTSGDGVAWQVSYDQLEQTHSQVEDFRDRLQRAIVRREAAAGVPPSAAVSPSPPATSPSASALPQAHVALEGDASSESGSAVLIGVNDGLSEDE